MIFYLFGLRMVSCLLKSKLFKFRQAWFRLFLHAKLDLPSGYAYTYPIDFSI